MLCGQCKQNEIIMETQPKKATKETPQAIPKRKSLYEGLKEIYREFFSNTSIHGFQYFGQQRPWKEVVFWIMVFFVTIYFCSSIIIKIYLKWHESPVIVSFSERSTPIWNIPFPAVTICPETKRTINKTDPKYSTLLKNLMTYVENGENFNENFTSRDLHHTLALMHICRSEIDGFLKIPQLKNTPQDYTKILDEMQPSFQKYFYKCKWFGNASACNAMFTKVYTDGGMCYTFNSLNVTDLYRDNVVQHQKSLNTSRYTERKWNKSTNWSLEEGYDATNDLKTFPARVLSSGSTAGLQLQIQSFMHEMDYTCNGAVQGFKILLHSPDDVPSVSKHFVRIAMDKEILIAVKPKMITTSEDIAAYDPLKRRCFMNKDRQLRFFKIYSQNNCQRECLTNFTYQACGCVRFSMPRTIEMPVCGADKISCYRQAKDQLLLKQFSVGLQSKANMMKQSQVDCNCMPSCTSLEYETELSEGHFDIVNTLEAFDGLEEYNRDFPGGRMSLVLIYFKENEFITSRRSELYGITELLANFGGVFGLFMGISILSIVEIFYHCTLRLWSNMRRV